MTTVFSDARFTAEYVDTLKKEKDPKMYDAYLFADSIYSQHTGRLSEAQHDRDVERFMDDESKTGPTARHLFELHGFIVRNRHGVFRSRYTSQAGFFLLDFTRCESHFVNDHVLTREVFSMEIERIVEALQSTLNLFEAVMKLKPTTVSFGRWLLSFVF